MVQKYKISELTDVRVSKLKKIREVLARRYWMYGPADTDFVIRDTVIDECWKTEFGNPTTPSLSPKVEIQRDSTTNEVNWVATNVIQPGNSCSFSMHTESS